MIPRLLILVAFAAAAGCGGRPILDRPNILLITVESVRTDHVGSYGYERATTPAIDALAAEGLLFENAYAPTSWTLPTHASLFTGLYPSAHRVVSSRNKLDDSYVTLAERLSEAGYQTAGFISGPWLQTPHNLHQGFETYDQSASSDKHSSEADVTNPGMERLLIDYLRSGLGEDRPFFLFAYLWDPHYDYIPPPPYDRTFVPEDAVEIEVRNYFTGGLVTNHIAPEQLAYVISQYDGELLWTDSLLGRLWRELKDRGLWDKTAIILTSDHGEEFFDHGTKGHKNNLYEESVHVPLIMKIPGESEGERSPRLTSLVDLYPTILKIAGVEDAGTHHGELLLGPSPPARRIYFELQSEWVFKNEATGALEYSPDVVVAIREGNHKLIVERNENVRELYDLATDPTELRPSNIEEAQGVAVSLYRGLLDHFVRMKNDAARWEDAGPAELSDEQIERLRSLGYIGETGKDE
jgi:arylsulfatase A-like enzyme